MFELQLYTSRAYGMVCALLCMHQLYFTNTVLDVAGLEQLLVECLGCEPASLCDMVDVRRKVLKQIPASVLGSDESVPAMDLGNLADGGKLAMSHVVRLAIVYPFVRDTRDALQTCIRAWSSYQDQDQDQDQDQTISVRDHCAALDAFLDQFDTQVSTIALSVHHAVRESRPKLIHDIYAVVLQHHTKTVSEYTNHLLGLMTVG
jgi:hypothetical protein